LISRVFKKKKKRGKANGRKKETNPGTQRSFRNIVGEKKRGGRGSGNSRWLVTGRKKGEKKGRERACSPYFF